MEKIKTYTIDYGGEIIVSDDLAYGLEQMIGVRNIENIGRIDLNDEVQFIITVEYKYTQAEYDEMPEYQ